MRAIAGIQARFSSTRLPGKVLLDLVGRPLIVRVYERALRTPGLDAVFVLTSDDPSDDALVDVLESFAIPYRRGPLNDVLQRYVSLIEEFDPQYVVRITGDCPLIDPPFIAMQLDALEAHDADFATPDPGGVERVLPGQGACSARALRAAAASSDPRDREHVGSFFFQEHRDRFRHVALTVPDLYRRQDVRLTVDEAPDLELMRRVFDACAEPVDLADALAWLDTQPELRAHNQDVQESPDNRRMRELEQRQIAFVGSYP